MASTPLLSDADYDAIAAAVMETARGRWFLAEFARRNRHADTQMLLEALARLEGIVREERTALAVASVEAKEPVPEIQPASEDPDPRQEDVASPPAEPLRVASPPIFASTNDDEIAPPAAPDSDAKTDQPVIALPREESPIIVERAPQAIVVRSDPLAPIMALSYEEKIALFS